MVWTNGQRRNCWVVWRGMPLLLFIVSMILLLWRLAPELNWIRWLAFITVITAVWLFFQPYTTWFCLDRNRIEMKKNTGIGTKEMIIRLQPSDRIVFEKVQGRSRISWWAVLDSGSKRTRLFVLHEPVFSSLAKEIGELEQMMANLTGNKPVG